MRRSDQCARKRCDTVIARAFNPHGQLDRGCQVPDDAGGKASLRASRILTRQSMPKRECAHERIGMARSVVDGHRGQRRLGILRSRQYGVVPTWSVGPSSRTACSSCPASQPCHRPHCSLLANHPTSWDAEHRRPHPQERPYPRGQGHRLPRSQGEFPTDSRRVARATGS